MSPDPALSLYVHVPFCSDKCLYCDFYSVPHRGVSASLASAVIEQTIEQGRVLLGALGEQSVLETAFVGGGTPSVLDRVLLARLLSFMRGVRPGPEAGPGMAEWTVEANPESVDEAFLDVCAAAGVDRLSLGVQTLREEHLRLMRRSSTRDSTLRGLGLAARRWSGRLSLDFIAGIPGQTPREVREDLSVLDSTGAGHVSLYQLTNEEGTPLASLVAKGSIALNPPETDEELWFAGRDELLRRGFQHYEISNFCRPGMQCRHNLRYWRMEPYLGVGPSAVSTLPARPLKGVLGDRAPCDGIVRLTNPRDLAAFAAGRDLLWGMQVESVSARDFLMENLMMGLRTDAGIERALFEHRFGAAFDTLFPGLPERWLAAGRLQRLDDRVALGADGRMLLDSLLLEAREALSPEAVAKLRIRWP